MTGDNVTRKCTRSNSNIDRVDHQALEAIEKENRAKTRREGKHIEKKQQAAVNIGKAAWDKVFTGESFDLPPTRFMEKVKAAVSEADFQDIKKGIRNTLQNEKDYLCGCNYSTLTEATNKIYSMLTEILIQEAGQVIDYDFKTTNQERNEIKKKMSQVEYNTNKANTIRASREGLLRELKAAKEELLKATQDERKKEATTDPGKDKIRDDTAV